MHDIFYFTDIHGLYNLYEVVMNYCMEQDPECTIIFGGDACDRGSDGYKIMKELLDNSQVLYLKGNHEDMFVNAARFILNDFHGDLTETIISNYLYSCSIKDYNCDEVRLALYNGGKDTLTAWMLDGMPNDFVGRIDKLPYTFSYENLDFCHAGGHYNTFMRVAEDEYEQYPINELDKTTMIWDRNLLGYGWKEGRICIFGHTPSIHLPAKYYGKEKSYNTAHPCAYIGTLDERWPGKKIDMDTGAIATNRIFVLNCLTLKAQGFEGTKKIECIQM